MSLLTRTCSPAFLLIPFIACGDGSPGDPTGNSNAFPGSDPGISASAYGGHAGKPHIVVVEFVGTAVGEFREIDGIQMDCFDIDAIDPTTGRVVGKGTDCLDLGSIAGGDPTAGEGFALDNTQFFHLHRGSIKSRLRTTIQPVVDASSPGNTHITGDVPGGTILKGTGRFKHLKGGVARLSGAVDMSLFFSDNTITFNCIFVLSRN